MSATSREPLQRLVADKIIPHYEMALESLRAIAAGTTDHEDWFFIARRPEGETNQD